MKWQGVDWGPGLMILALGLVAGALFVWWSRRGKASQAAALADAVAAGRDLSARKDELLRQLADLEASRAKLDPADFDRQQVALELDLARTLKAADEGAGRADTPAAATSPAPAGGSSAVKGFVWGVTAAGAIAGLLFWVAQTATPREAGSSPMMGPAAAAGGDEHDHAASPQPPSAEEQQLRAQLEQDPDNADLRISLVRVLLSQGDMMTVWNETEYVLKRHPGEPRATSYQALVRVAMGQPDMAVEMLQGVLKTSPDLEDAYLHLAFAQLSLGNEKAAEVAMAEARRRFPEDAPTLSRVFDNMKARVAEKAAASQGGEANPHAGLGEGPAPAMAQAPHPAPTAPAAAPVSSGAGGTGRSVSGTLRLEGLTVAPGAIVFVLARPAGVTAGPPVAVARLQVASFPAAFELGAANSMTGAPLPDKVRVEARLDADGDAASRDPSDPKGALDDVAAGSTGLELVLTR